MPHPPKRRKRWLTVEMAAGELGVSKQSVWRWLKNTTEEQVPRQRHRLRDPSGKSRLTLVVEYNALRDYSDTL